MMRRLWVLGMALSLAGCVTPTMVRPAQFWSGRLGLQVWSDPPQSYHAGFELQGSAEEGVLTLLSPVGGVMARLQWDPRLATLERGNDRWQESRVDLLMQQLTPAPFPIAALFDWLQGLDASDRHWTVDLSRHGEGRILARRIEPLPRAELRLLLDR